MKKLGYLYHSLAARPTSDLIDSEHENRDFAVLDVVSKSDVDHRRL